MRFHRTKPAPAPLPTLTDHQAHVLTIGHEACHCHGDLTRAYHMAAIYQRARQRLAELDTYAGTQ